MLRSTPEWVKLHSRRIFGLYHIGTPALENHPKILQTKRHQY